MVSQSPAYELDLVTFRHMIKLPFSDEVEVLNKYG